MEPRSAFKISLFHLKKKNNTLRSFFFSSLQFLPCVPFLRLYWHSKQILSALQTSDWIWGIPEGSPANVTHIYLWDKREKIFNKTYNWKSMVKIIHFGSAWSISLPEISMAGHLQDLKKPVSGFSILTFFLCLFLFSL